MALSIDALTNTYLEQAQNSSSTNGLKNTLSSNLNNATDDELMDACKEFETYFTEQVFKAMEKMIPESESTSASNSQLKDYYKEQIIKEYAEASTEGQGLGIAQMMYEQMKRNYTDII